ncbi:MAG TPA: hypothetical protein VK561_21840, partial [Bradyrhizobium sp.]|nr:hypothetical protein [Bradyrhizobium sp.]
RIGLANNWLLHLEDIRHVHARLLNAIRTEGRSQQACARANRETQGEHSREGEASVSRDQALRPQFAK